VSPVRIGAILLAGWVVLVGVGVGDDRNAVAAATGSYRHRCAEIGAFPLKAAAGDVRVPVVVHYMRNPARPKIDLSKGQGPFSPADLEQRFGDSGTFNTVWKGTTARVRLDLYRLESCPYSLREFGYAKERNEVPSPAADPSLFPNLLARYNGWGSPASAAAPKGASAPGRVLDLYIFEKIDIWAGWSGAPRIAPETPGRLGAVWIDTDCLAGNDCDRLFGHEVGHFLDLCHVCRSASSQDDLPTSCRFNYCPKTGSKTTTTPICAVNDARLMGPAYTGSSLLPCEVSRVAQRAALLFTP
jgi:hypothetical protein